MIKYSTLFLPFPSFLSCRWSSTIFTQRPFPQCGKLECWDNAILLFSRVCKSYKWRESDTLSIHCLVIDHLLERWWIFTSACIHFLADITVWLQLSVFRCRLECARCALQCIYIFRINFSLSYRIVLHYQTVTLAWKLLNANVKCCAKEANVRCCFTVKRETPNLLSFQSPINQEAVNDNHLSCSLRLYWDCFCTTFELPSLSVIA